MAGSAAAATTATPEQTRAPVDRRALEVTAGALVVAGFAMGVLLAVRRPLTVDEAAIVGALDGGFRTSVEASLEHAPAETAFRALLYPLAGADAPDWALRIPSLVAVAVAAALALATGRHVAGRFAGLVAAAVVAIGAVTAGVAYEARPHALALLFVSLSTLLFVLAMTRAAVVPWLAWALVASFVPLAHPACAAAVVAQLIALAVGFRGQPRVVVPAALTVAAVAGLLVTAPAVDRWHSADTGTTSGLWTAAGNTAAWSPIALAAAIAGVVVLARRRKLWQATLVAGLAAGPPVAIAITAVAVPVHPARAAALALPGIALAAGVAVAEIADRRLAAVVVALVAAASLAVVALNVARGPTADWPRAADWIAEHAATGETVVVVPPRARAAYTRYADGTRLYGTGRGDGVWVVLRTPSEQAVATARTVVATPRYALREEDSFGDDLVVEHWVRP